MTLKALLMFSFIFLGNLYTCNYEEPMPQQGSCDGVYHFREGIFFDYKGPLDSSWTERLMNHHTVKRMSVSNDIDTTKYLIAYRNDYHYSFHFGQLEDSRNYYLELNESDVDTISVSTFNHTDSCHSYKVLDTLKYNGDVVFINDRIPLHYKHYHTIVIDKDYSYP